MFIYIHAMQHNAFMHSYLHCSSLFHHCSSFFIIFHHCFIIFHHCFTIVLSFSSCVHHSSSFFFTNSTFLDANGSPLLGTPRERLAQLAQSWHAGRDRWPLGGSPPVVPFENDDLATINGVVFPVLQHFIAVKRKLWFSYRTIRSNSYYSYSAGRFINPTIVIKCCKDYKS